MPDYFRSELSTGCAGHPGAAPWPAKSYKFPASEAPDALFIDLGQRSNACRATTDTAMIAACRVPKCVHLDVGCSPGTNDVARAEFPKAKGGDPSFELRFAQETVDFMKNATVLYRKPDIQFFLNAGARCSPVSHRCRYRQSCPTVDASSRLGVHPN